MKILSIARSLSLTLLVLAGAAAAYTESAAEAKLSPKQQEKYLEKLEVNFRASRTLQAGFVQEKHLLLFQDVLTSSGTFSFAVPSSLRWEIKFPFHSLLIMNGRELAKYDFIKGKPRKLKLPAADALFEMFDQIAGLHQGKFSEQAEKYEITVYCGEAERLVLVPKDKKMRRFLPAIEIRFSRALDSVRSVLIREGGSDYTLIRFEDVRLNPELPGGLFSTQQK
ncbi:MAG: hypothetical protein COT18_08900 [Elusimicrobia bacterium CG08_land_8_20_14_0_20_59_10]|nr:MAG: hypothetical protein COT18_08900 [Elusimicrobia bacterium CG08_land_8_20_14_0_20_59_10]